MAARLREAAQKRQRAHDEADAEFRELVLAALKVSSMRKVAAVAGVSPTTVHAWSKGQER
jgi:hypothetical protein